MFNPHLLVQALALVLAFAPGEASADRSLERRIDDAIEGSRSREFGTARLLGDELIAADPEDWRGWYLVALADRARTLDSRQDQLAHVSSPRRREEFRLIARYLTAPWADREQITRTAATTDSESAIASALLASSIAHNGRPKEALVLAYRALELDPELFLAARAVASSVQALDSEEQQRTACSLLARFPYDAVVVRTGLQLCSVGQDMASRLTLLEPVVRQRRSSLEGERAMRLLLSGNAMLLASTHDLERLIRLLDPQDETWWQSADGLLHAFLRAEPRAGGSSADTFLLALHASTTAGQVPIELTRLTSLVAARRLESLNEFERASGVLSQALPRIPVLRRATHYEALSRAEQAQGRDSEAAHARALAVQLTDPGTSGNMDLFPTLELSDLVGPDSELKPWLGRPGQPTIVFFWDIDCHWSTALIPDFVKAQRDRAGPFAHQDVAILWVHRRALAEIDDFGKRSQALGIDPRVVVSPGPRADRILREEFGVDGTPWIALALTERRMVYEGRGNRAQDVLARIALWLDARRGEADTDGSAGTP